MIDVHTHILPGVDDGSRNEQESIAMLRECCRQGIRNIIATPHFYADRMKVEDFLQRRKESMQRLKEALKQEKAWDGPLRLRTGAEVYFFMGMGRAEKLPELCMAGTDLLLLEMPFVQWDDRILQEVEDILSKQRLRLLLAHVERYPEFQKDKSVWNRIMEMSRQGDLTLQVNGGSFLKSRSRRKFCLRLLEDHPTAVIGSDCHNMSSRVPNLGEAVEVIRKKLGADRITRMEKAEEDLLAAAPGENAS